MRYNIKYSQFENTENTKNFNYETNKVITKISGSKLPLICVEIDVKNKTIILGRANKNLCKNIIFRQMENSNATSFTDTIVAISKDIFPKDSLLWCPKIGSYVFCTEPLEKQTIEIINKYTKVYRFFPYSFVISYGASDLLPLFTKNKQIFKKTIDSKITSLVPYTFGIEYETSEGLVPEEECFKAGIIPLKDGSITGNEYATIVMDSKEDFERIKYQLEILKTHTKFDKECALHIHFGNYDLSPLSILILYNICYSLQSELVSVLPDQSFYSDLYKNSKKNYCKMLPDYTVTFNKLYSWLSSNTLDFTGNLELKHPKDPEKQSKWNIAGRYYWVNFIHACFYKSPKTIEFRILRPTYNYNKIVNWIYIFNAILQYSQKITNDLVNSGVVNSGQTCLSNTSMEEIHKLSLSDIVKQIYPKEISSTLVTFLHNLINISTTQCTLFSDYCGATTDYEDTILLENVFK